MPDMVDPVTLGKALGARLAEIRAVMARYDAFAYQPGEEPRGTEEPLGGEAAARDFVLTALRVASEPVSYTLLSRMAAGDASLADLGAATGLPRLAVWERLATLVAAGLAGRSLETDAAGLTTAGAAVVALVEEAAAAAAAEARP